MLGFDNFCQTVNTIFFNNRDDLVVEVHAFSPGSFVVEVIISATGSGIVAFIVFLAARLLSARSARKTAVREKNGKSPVSDEQAEAAERNVAIVDALRGIAAPLRNAGVTRIEINSVTTSVNVTREEVKMYID